MALGIVTENNRVPFADDFNKADFDRFMNSLEQHGYDSFAVSSAEVDKGNLEKRLACVILCDTSSSVADYMTEIKSSVKRTIRTILANDIAVERVELSLMTFNSSIDVVVPLQEVYKFGSEGGEAELLPEIEEKIDQLYAYGSTHTGQALMAAYNEIKSRESDLREADIAVMIPLLILVTDGVPYYRGDCKKDGEEIFENMCNIFEKSRAAVSHDEEKIHVVTVAVGESSENPIFRKIGGDNTVNMNDPNYDKIFRGIANSIVRTSMNGRFNLEDMIDW